MGKRKKSTQHPASRTSTKNKSNSAGPSSEACQHYDKAFNMSHFRKSVNAWRSLSCSKQCGRSDNDSVVCVQCGAIFCLAVSKTTGHALEHFQTPRSDCHAMYLSVTGSFLYCVSCEKSMDAYSAKAKNCLGFIRKVKITMKSEVINEPATVFDSSTVNDPSPACSLESDKCTHSLQRVRGFDNLGNTCFFNSVVQNLMHTKWLLDVLIYLERHYKLRTSLSTLDVEQTGPLTESIRNLGNQYHSGSTKAFSPRCLFQALCGQCPMFKSLEQQDSQELFATLVNGMFEEDESRVKQAILKHHRAPCAEEGEEDNDEKVRISGKMDKFTRLEIKKQWKSVQQYNPVSVIFGGTLTRHIKCLTCSNTNSKVESFISLSLALPLSERLNVDPIVHTPTTARQWRTSASIQKQESKRQRSLSEKFDEKKTTEKSSDQFSDDDEEIILGDLFDFEDPPNPQDAECPVPILQSSPVSAMKDSGEEKIQVELTGNPESMDEEITSQTENCPEESSSHDLSEIQSKLQDMSLSEGFIVEESDVHDEQVTVPSSSPTCVTDNELTTDCGRSFIDIGESLINKLNTEISKPLEIYFNTDPIGNDTNCTEIPQPLSGVDVQHSHTMESVQHSDSAYASQMSLNSSSSNVAQLRSENASPKSNKEETHSDEEMGLGGLFLSELDSENGNLETSVESVEDQSDLLETDVSFTPNFDDPTEAEKVSTLGSFDTKGTEKSVMSLLKDFITHELLTGCNKIKCDKCEDKESLSSAACWYRISQTPSILVLHLKRFSQSGLRLKKLNTMVKIEPVIDIAPFCATDCKLESSSQYDNHIYYKLYGIVEHVGSLTRGHYTAYVRQLPGSEDPKPTDNVKELLERLSGQAHVLSSSVSEDGPAVPQASSLQSVWYHISDRNVREVSMKCVLNSSPYMLFYEKIT